MVAHSLQGTCPFSGTTAEEEEFLLHVHADPACSTVEPVNTLPVVTTLSGSLRGTVTSVVVTLALTM